MNCRLLLTLALLMNPIDPPANADDSGSIFREYTFVGRWGEIDTGATHPMQKDWPRRRERMLEHVDLGNAVRAEMAVEYWGGHIGTSGQRFQVNGNDWIDIPQPANTPTNPHYYYRTLLGHPAVEVPLEHLKDGTNTLVFSAGPQTKYDFGFGFYWVYAFTLRVYYDPTTAHPRGEVVFPRPGDVIGDMAVFVADVEGEDIERVDFIGYYEDFDWAGNGLFRDWQFQIQNGVLQRLLGKADQKPYAITWENTWVPDQVGIPMRVKARITDKNGMIFETPPVDDILLRRHDRSVKLYPATGIPEVFGVSRAGGGECSIPVSDPVDAVRAARMAISTWSGGELHEVRLNETRVAGAIGRVNNFGFDVLTVPPEAVRTGDNIVHFFSFADYHKAEINWPGPALLLEFQVDDEDGRAALESSMLAALKHEAPEVRTYAARQLGSLASTRGVTPLIAALEDEHWQVRSAAAYSLGQIADPAATEPLIEVLRREPPFTPYVWEVRRDAAFALSRMRGPEAESILKEADQTADPLLKRYTSYALERLQKEKE